MTKLADFLAARGPTEMYEAYWVPRTLWPFAVSLVEVVAPGDRVLDVGAGTGLLSELALARSGAGGTVTALEPTPFMIEVLHRKFDGAPRITIVEKGIEEAGLPDAAFDVVLCHQVVQYLADLPNAFSEFHRVLKPGGTLGVGVWSGPKEQDASILETGFRRYFGDSFAPIHAWSFGGTERLRDLALDAGFSVERIETQRKLCRFESIEEMMNVHIAAGMRFQDDQVLMGLFDLSDRDYERQADALLTNLHEALGAQESPTGFHLNFASDVLIAIA